MNQRIIGEIRHDAKGHPYAVLDTAYDANGNGRAAGTKIYAVTPPVLIKFRPLVKCAASKDGDCIHPDCPQAKSRESHCPLDTGECER